MGERASETAVPFTNGSDSLEGAGHSVLGLLERAAGMAEKNIQHARGVAQNLSRQLQSAEEQIQELKADVRHYKDIADQAEKYLRLLLLERDQKAFASAEGRSHPAQARQSGPEIYAPPKYRNG
jgi:chromosome segregation ATPase